MVRRKIYNAKPHRGLGRKKRKSRRGRIAKGGRGEEAGRLKDLILKFEIIEEAGQRRLTKIAIEYA